MPCYAVIMDFAGLEKPVRYFSSPILDEAGAIAHAKISIRHGIIPDRPFRVQEWDMSKTSRQIKDAEVTVNGAKVTSLDDPAIQMMREMSYKPAREEAFNTKKV